MKFRTQVAIIAARCYILGMETVNPIVFNCNDLTLRRVHKVLGQSNAVPDVLKAMRDEKTLYRKRRLKILPFTVEEYEKSHGKVDLSGAYGVGINPYLCDSYIYPSPLCRMRKLSYRATEFLLSLGSPTKELRIEYRKHLAEMARMGPVEEIQTGIKASFYEELIELPLNAHFEYIHLLASEEMCYVIHRRDPGQGENEFFNLPVAETVRSCDMLGPDLVYDDDYDNKNTGRLFDVEGLLANLWIAEETRTCQTVSEPRESRTETDRKCIYAGKKPLKHSAAYRYIHITDDNWKKYSPALTSTREYGNFNVPCWLVRAHYARMHGKTVLVKAHFAYRRKGAVNETAVTDYIV